MICVSILGLTCKELPNEPGKEKLGTEDHTENTEIEIGQIRDKACGNAFLEANELVNYDPEERQEAYKKHQ